jgi:uncharacterized repeat protein (TIGR01451 family)
VAIHVRVPATGVLGQELEFRLSIANQSSAPAHHVLVRNPLPANARFVRANPEPSARAPELLWQLGTLEAGGSREIILVLMPLGQGDVKNCARVQFEHGQCVTTRILQPALQLRKQGPTQAVLYDVLKYQLTVTNNGTAEATGVTLADTLPLGLEHSSAKNPLTWDIGTLAPAQSRTVEYQVVAKLTGRLCNRAVATSAGGLREEVESCIVVGEAKLALTKTGPTRRYANLITAYQLTVSNTGTASLSNVAIFDPLPAETRFVSASAGGRLVGNEVQWLLGGLAPGANRTVDVVLRPQKAGQICNRATATADRGLTAQAEACTEFIGVSALLLEVVDTDDPVEVGADTSYVILVRNQGTADARDVRIVAQVPEQMDITRVTGPSDHRKEGQTIRFEPLNLPPQGQARYLVYVKAKAPGDVRFKVDMTAEPLKSGPVHEEESTTIYSDVPATQPPSPPGSGRSRTRIKR